MITLRTIDAHVAGEPLRLVVEGFPTPRGRTMLDKRDWVKRHADRLRRVLMLEPRGHRELCGAVLTEPVLPGSHTGILFMHNEGFAAMSAHGIIASTIIALGRGLLIPGGDGSTIVYDTVAGTVRTLVTRDSGSAFRSVSVLNVPSFVLHGGLPVNLGARVIRADLAFGGAFYAIVDSESAGLGIDVAHVPELRRVGMAIARAIEAQHRVEHPLEPRLAGIEGTIFTGPPTNDRADLRSVTVFANAAIDRSPCGTGMSAVMAVLSAMNLLTDGRTFLCESLVGTELSGRVEGRTMVGDHEAILPEIAGAAWITGEHTFYLEDDDIVGEGFLG